MVFVIPHNHQHVHYCPVRRCSCDLLYWRFPLHLFGWRHQLNCKALTERSIKLLKPCRISHYSSRVIILVKSLNFLALFPAFPISILCFALRGSRRAVYWTHTEEGRPGNVWGCVLLSCKLTIPERGNTAVLQHHSSGSDLQWHE